MMRTLVAYYSRKGSNLYLARKIANRLNADIEAIRPRVNAFGLFLMGINPGIRRMRSRIDSYDRIILVGPIWMGRFIPPLNSFSKKYRKQIKELVFVTCCGSTYDKKDEKFGHGLVFQKVEELLGDRLTHTQAFPVGLILPEDQREDHDAFMKARLSDENFHGEIADRFEQFMKKVA